MSAMVESMMFHGKLPWHGEGQRINDDDRLDIERGLEASGTNWEVDLVDLITVPKAQEAVDYALGCTPVDQVPVVPNVQHRAVVRETDKSILGVVGPRYHPLQNREAFEWFQPFLDAEACTLHTAGSLYNGRKVWVLAQLNSQATEIVKGDDVAKFILLSNSHDGTTAVRVGYTPIRVVCANTLAMAQNANASQLLRVRHTRKMQANLDEIRDIMKLADATFEATAEQYQWLASRQVNVSDLRKYVKIVLNVDNIKDDELPTRTKNTIDQIVGLTECGQGNSSPYVRGTWWAAYNGVTEYLNHTQGRNVNNRLNSLWFGSNVKQNKTALDKALELAA